MLADDIVTNKKLPQWYPGFEKIQSKLSNAQKFMLSQDFAIAADGLVDNFKELRRIAPFCRIPYPSCWFEFSQAHRRHWVEAPTHYPTIQSLPGSVGFYLRAHDASLMRWTTVLCWSLKEVKIPNGTPYNTSLLAVEYDLSKLPAEPEQILDLHDYIHVVPAPFRSLTPIPADVANEFVQVCRSDWAGEIRYLFAILGLLNAKNVVEPIRNDYTKINRARKRNGKLPLFEHTLLKIRAIHRRSLMPSSASSVARAGELRSHFIRGHFKQRRTGIFWWSPHIRGNVKQGFKDKSYVLS